MKRIIIRHPKQIERQYEKILLSVVRDDYLAIIANLISFLAKYNFFIKNDDILDDFENVKKNIVLGFASKVFKITNEVNNIFDRLDTFNKTTFENVLNFAAAINNQSKNLLKKTWIADNVTLIKSIQNQALDKVSSVVHQAIIQKSSSKQLASELKQIAEVSKNRAKLIARDQIAKANAVLTKERNLSLGITNYQWLTGRDERVRPTHKALEGKICNWNNDKVYKDNANDKHWKNRNNINAVEKIPGFDFNCRCTSIAMVNFDNKMAV